MHTFRGVQTAVLCTALVKVKVALSVVVNTIFWWSASNHSGHILFSRSDNMDLCRKGFSDEEGGGGNVFWKAEQLVSTNIPGGGLCESKLEMRRLWSSSIQSGACEVGSEAGGGGGGGQAKRAGENRPVWYSSSWVRLHVRLRDVIVQDSCESSELSGCVLNTFAEVILTWTLLQYYSPSWLQTAGGQTLLGWETQMSRYDVKGIHNV